MSKPINWDKVTALSAVLIGACALGVSFYTARLQLAQVEAQTWPLLQLWRSDEARTLWLSNRGVGPARIFDVKLRVDGTETASLGDALNHLDAAAFADSKQSYFSRRVLATNEDVQILQLPTDTAYRTLISARNRLTFEICFCSVLKDCYVLDERAQDEQNYVRSVAACPIGKAGIFR